MTSPALLVALALAVSLVGGGAVASFASNNALKKVVAVLTALVGASLGLAVLGAPGAAVMTALAIALGYCIVGVAVVVRLQEGYGVIEAGDLDAADEQDEPRGPDT